MSLNLIEYRPPRIAQLLVVAAALLHWTTPLREMPIYSNTELGTTVGLAGFLVML